MKKKIILSFILVGIGCFIIGVWIGMRSKSVYTLGWVNVRAQTKDFIFEISIKDRSILQNNSIEYIEQTFKSRIHDITGDLTVPIELKDYFNHINNVARDEKIKALQESIKKDKEKPKYKPII